MLNDRSSALLKTLVERYIAEGQPVGSRTLSKFSGLDLSPASIRNVMADLEELGLITSPHTSAGRVPTQLGYRLFVDRLLQVQALDAVEVLQMESELAPDNPQKLISQASQLLSELTRFAGVVVSARRTSAFRQLEFVQLSDKRVLLILITADGDVQNRILFCHKSYSSSELIEAANFLNQHYSGRSFDEVKMDIHLQLQRLRGDISTLMASALSASEEALSDSENFVISGEGNLLNVDDLSSNMTSLRRLFSAFDQKTELLRLLDLSQRAQGVQIYIGSESGILPVEDCSVITAPYSQNGRAMGTLGVIGPTRMAYHRVIPIVDITARLLSSALSYGGEAA